MRQFERKGDRLLACEYDENFEGMYWMNVLPAFQFKPDWIVQIIPPIVGAVIRFKVTNNKITPREVSVYFDGYGNLGFYEGKPYWEIHPAAENDIERFLLGEENEMLEAIEKSLQKIGEMQNEEKASSGIGKEICSN